MNRIRIWLVTIVSILLVMPSAYWVAKHFPDYSPSVKTAAYLSALAVFMVAVLVIILNKKKESK